MEANNDKKYFDALKNAIEQKSGWGDCNQWSTQDFQALNEAILEATKVNLSVTTLKRMLGKVQYNAQPRVSTLDALAKYLNYADWRGFKRAIDESQQVASVHKERKSQYLPYRRALLLVLVIAVVGIIVALTNDPKSTNRQKAKPNNSKTKQTSLSSEAQFTIRKVSLGLPNTVVFGFDVDQLSAKKLQIQQSWDPSKRIDVKQGQYKATCMYYYPGYYQAKLVADDQILKERELLVESAGWVVTLDDGKSKPEYLLGQDVIKKRHLQLSPKRKQMIAEYKQPRTLNYCYFKGFEDISGSDFTFESGLRHTLKDGKLICQKAKVNIVGSKGALSIPLAIPGCVGELSLYLNGESLKGDAHDLSGFGCDFSKMQHLKVVNRQNLLHIYLNDKLIWKQPLKNDLGKIAGVRYRFVGDGEVDYVRYYNSKGKAVFKEEF